METAGDDDTPKQWPDDPLPFARWLEKRFEQWSTLKTLQWLDKGVTEDTLKATELKAQSKQKKICPHRLKNVATVFIFLGWDRPMTTFVALNNVDSATLGVVSNHVHHTLASHFLIPTGLSRVTQCLRPDIINTALKTWKHGISNETIDCFIRSLAAQQWNFHAYCFVGQRVFDTLLWLGAALLVTGRKRNADITIGNLYVLATEKDKIATALMLVIGAQHDPHLKCLLADGPTQFQSITLLPAVF